MVGFAAAHGAGHRDAALRIGVVFALMLVVSLLFSTPATAQGRISLIRDAEIEEILQRFCSPVFEAAGLAPADVHLYIVNDSRLNAFVAGGMNMFLNTGFLMRTEHPGQLIGVVAHEAGHIAGGHLSRVPMAQRRAAVESILATVLGAAVAVAGAPELGTAIITGGQSYAQGSFLRFSRSQEQAADQAAITFLERANLSPQGLAEFLDILESQNALTVSASNPYLQTHPLTRDRVAFVTDQARHSQAPPRGPEAWLQDHHRMVVKLEAFLKEPHVVMSRYQHEDGLEAAYARAIALYRLPDLEGALAEINGLLVDHPDDPYFHELKGQMLFENGRVADAIAPYRRAVDLRRSAALLKIGLAQALIEHGGAAANREAVAHLEEAVQRERNNAMAWRLLGIAHGRAGTEGLSSLALAEYALLIGKDDDARLYARRAEGKIEPSDPAWLRLQDILRVIDAG